MIREILSDDLFSLVGKRMDWTQDETGNVFGWLRLKHPGRIGAIAEYLAGKNARLCTMTTYAGKRSDPHKRRSQAYHFTLSSLLITITTPLYDVTTYEPLPVASITPWFRNADWNERESMEMFNIEVSGHPNPKPLFLDERMEKGLMAQLLPFSALVQGIATTTLWERVMASKVAAQAEAERDRAVAARPVPGPDPDAEDFPMPAEVISPAPRQSDVNIPSASSQEQDAPGKAAGLKPEIPGSKNQPAGDAPVQDTPAKDKKNAAKTTSAKSEDAAGVKEEAQGIPESADSAGSAKETKVKP